MPDGLPYYDTEELLHYGVLGMKWGVRKDNPNYSKDQRARDTEIYGKRGARRINRATAKGASISVARGKEKTRRDKVLMTNKYVRQGGKIVGAGSAIAAVNIGMSQAAKLMTTSRGFEIINTLTGGKNPGEALNMASTIKSAMSDPAARVAASAGAALIGEMLSGDIAVSTRMRVHGYNPNRR